MRCIQTKEQFDDVIFTDETTTKIQTTTRQLLRKEGEHISATGRPKHPYQVDISMFVQFRCFDKVMGVT